MNETALDGSRSCAGCRQTDAREALLRFVAAGAGQNELAPDIRRRAPGRGVSVHPRYRCVEAAVRSGAFKRALGVDEVAPARELSRSAAGQYRRRAESLLSSAKRARKVALGTDAARRALEQRELELLLVAQDAEGSREELMQTADRLGLRCLVWSNKQDLGRVFGRALLSIVGVTDAGIATELRHVVRCATELAEDA
jgi:predicted RNA-binding protein YlxR (DUF448 family)/ribosomal protein L30E